MIRPNRTNPEFELGGVSHVAHQHFFFNAGNGDCVGFFWFTDTPAARPGFGDTVTAVGSMNHPALACPSRTFDEYPQRLIDRGVVVGPVLNHDESESQVH
jgi:hypothetical protein